MSNKRVLGNSSVPDGPVNRLRTPVSPPVVKMGIPTAHLHTHRSDSTCAVCNVNIKSNYHHCSKCGLLFCNQHRPHFTMVLDSHLEVVPYDQKPDISFSAKCCEICLYNSPGWTQCSTSPATIRDRTCTFVSMRSKASQGTQLDNLILERRMGKLINWIAGQIQSSFPHATKIDFVKLQSFESKLCIWSKEPDCEICHSSFGFFARKHHCRLCGRTVCGELTTGCSMPIPLTVICEIMNESKISTAISKDDNCLRICKCCRRAVLDKRVFAIQQKHTSPVFKLVTNWNKIQSLLEREDLTTVESNQQSLKLIGLFNRGDTLTKEISKLIKESPTLKRDEIQILLNLQLMIAEFIQEKLPIFRKAQEDKLKKEQDLLRAMTPNAKPKITKKDLRELREKLMVLNEQKFIVQNIQSDLKKQRKFEDLKTLDSNLNDLNKEIEEIQLKLGDESF